MIENTSFKGRGSFINPGSRFVARHYDSFDASQTDEWEDLKAPVTRHVAEHPRTILNIVKSPDLPEAYSLNPYQGCEHGCVYCYARPTHEYYGYSAGLDFETIIHYKPDAPRLLEKAFNAPSYTVKPIMLSGNTDCYQPAERSFRITRKLLEVCLAYRHPVSLITKNALILRDLDILMELAQRRLVHVNISLTTLNEDLRRKLEPRTATGLRRLETLAKLAESGIPVRCLIGPVIPFLNSVEIPSILKSAADAGAADAGYILIRLNGSVKGIFESWLRTHYPDRAERVLNAIAQTHGGQTEDYRFGKRMRGEGAFAESLARLFQALYRKYFSGSGLPPYNLNAFIPRSGRQLSLF